MDNLSLAIQFIDQILTDVNPAIFFTCKTLLKIISQCKNIIPKDSAYLYAITNESIPFFKWCESMFCKMDVNSVIKTIGTTGSIDFLNYFHHHHLFIQNFSREDIRILLITAAQCGHKRIFDWVFNLTLEIDSLIFEEILYQLAYNGHMTLLQRIYRKTKTWCNLQTIRICEAAAYGGHLGILQ